MPSGGSREGGRAPVKKHVNQEILELRHLHMRSMPTHPQIGMHTISQQAGQVQVGLILYQSLGSWNSLII